MVTCETAGHERGHGLPGVALEQIPQPLPLVAGLDLLQADQRGADPAAGHDQAVARQVVHVDQCGRTEVLGRLQRLQQGVVGVPAPARTEHGAAPRHRVERIVIEQTFHDPVTGRGQVVSCYAAGRLSVGDGLAAGAAPAASAEFLSSSSRCRDGSSRTAASAPMPNSTADTANATV
jgi:hypothetical protein